MVDVFFLCTSLLSTFVVCLLIPNRKEEPLMREGVNPVWGRDGLLIPKRGNEATFLQSSDQNGDQTQVRLSISFLYLTVTLCFFVNFLFFYIILFILLYIPVNNVIFQGLHYSVSFCCES